MNKRNLGKFELDLRLLQEDPELVAEVFAFMRLVPVRAEIIDFGNVVEYLAISDKFKEVPRGAKAPEYSIRILKNDNGHVRRVEVVAL